MTDNGGNDRRRDIEGRINTLGAGGNSLSGRGNRSRHGSRDGSTETETGNGGVSSGLDETDEKSADASSAGADAEAITEDADDSESEVDSDEEADADTDTEADTDADADESDDEAEVEDEDETPLETREEDVDQRSSLEIEMDRFVRAFAARRANQVGEDSLDDYIVGSVKGYLAGLLGGDVESPGTLERKVEVEADDIFGGLLDTVATDDQDRGDVVVEAIGDAHDVPEDDELVVAGLRDHEALLNGVVANNSNELGDVSEVVQAAVETRLIEEDAE